MNGPNFLSIKVAHGCILEKHYWEIKGNCYKHLTMNYTRVTKCVRVHFNDWNQLNAYALILRMMQIILFHWDHQSE